MSTDLPSHWRLGVIRDVVDPARPVTYGVVQPGPRQEKGIPIIRGMNYSSGVVDTADLYLVSPNIADAYRRSTVRGGDLLFSIVGYLGLTAQVPEQLTGANITQTTARISVRDGQVPRYFLHLFRSAGFAPEVRRWQKGSAQPGLNLADVERLRIPIPPEAEQRRIAEILDAADEAIRGTEAVIAKLRSVQLGLLNTLIGPDEGSHPVELLNVCRGPGVYGSPAAAIAYSPSLPRYVRITDITDDGLLDPAARASIPEEQARDYILEEGDLLFARSGATVGKTYLYAETDGRCAHAGYVIRFKIDPAKALARFIFLFTQTSAYRAWVQRTLRQGAQPNINAEEYGSLAVPCPSLAAQRRVASALGASDERLRCEEAYLAKLKLQKQGLMQDLLTGRVRVAA